MSEAEDQATVVQWCRWQKIPLYHIPNGGKRTKTEARRLKAHGVSKGVPDLCIPVPRRGYHGLYIEMKFGNGKTTKEQDDWLKLLNANGYMAVVCRGVDSAIHEIRRYMEDR